MITSLTQNDAALLRGIISTLAPVSPAPLRKKLKRLATKLSDSRGQFNHYVLKDSEAAFLAIVASKALFRLNAELSKDDLATSRSSLLESTQAVTKVVLLKLGDRLSISTETTNE